jgi:anti-anti-sigma regulatory factor
MFLLLSPAPAFADVAYIHERLRKYTARAEAYSAAAGTHLQYLLLDMSPVTHLDTTGQALRLLL